MLLSHHYGFNLPFLGDDVTYFSNKSEAWRIESVDLRRCCLSKESYICACVIAYILSIIYMYVQLICSDDKGSGRTRLTALTSGKSVLLSSASFIHSVNNALYYVTTLHLVSYFKNQLVGLQRIISYGLLHYTALTIWYNW